VQRAAHRSTLAAALFAALVATAAAAGAGSGAEPLPEPTLEALMRGLATTPGVVVDFREVKELALLSVPLEVRGTLYFAPPDRLVRATTEPSRSRLLIAGERFAFHDEAGGEAFDLAGNPVAREFVSSFIVLFNGDLAALRERYQPDFRVDGERWELVLEPRRRPLADIVERIRISGVGRAMTRMELLETDGDRTTTFFDVAQTDRRLSDEELEQIFARPGALPDAP
jgi:outer membrane lipoprotein-sorting protein